VGGLAVALARMAIASGIGAAVALPDGAPGSAAVFGECTGRVIVAVTASRVPAMRAAAATAGVESLRLGDAGGGELRIGSGLRAKLADLEAAYRTGF
jgi:phosphoribosylformylglycinamidine (FGAM) synthase-like enzyme